jgi:hypothetical protein
VSLILLSVTCRSADSDPEDSETASSFGGLLVMCVDGCLQLVAHGDLVADTGCDDELRGTDEVLQVGWGVLAELEVTGVEVPRRRISYLHHEAVRPVDRTGVKLTTSLG